MWADVGNSSEQVCGRRPIIRPRWAWVNGGVNTWARLPKERWPTELHANADPVVLVEKAIHGHTDSRGNQEEYVEAAAVNKQRTGIPSWPSLYGRP